MKTEKRLTMALSVLVALMMLAVPLASSSNLFVDGGQTNSNGDAPLIGDNADPTNSTFDWTGVDGFQIVNTFIIDSVASYNLIKNYYGITSTGGEGRYDKDWAADPWIAIVYSSKGTVKSIDLTISNDNLKSGVTSTNENNLTTTVSDKKATVISNSELSLTGTDKHSLVVSLNKELGLAKEKFYGDYSITLKTNDGTVSDSVTYANPNDVKIIDSWIVYDQKSLDKIGNYVGKDIQNSNFGETWSEDWNTSGAWIAIAYTTPAEVGSVDFTAQFGDSKSTLTTAVGSSNGTHVFTAFVNGNHSGKDCFNLSVGTGDYPTMYYGNYSVNVAGANSSYKFAFGSDATEQITITFNLNVPDSEGRISLDEVKANLVLDSSKTNISFSYDPDNKNILYATFSKDSNSMKYPSIGDVLNAINPSKTGYDFVSWTDENGVQYDPKSTINDSFEKSIIMNANWEINDGFVQTPVDVLYDGTTYKYSLAMKVVDGKTVNVSSSYIVGLLPKEIKTSGYVINQPDLESNPTDVYSYIVKENNADGKDLKSTGLVSMNSSSSVFIEYSLTSYTKITVSCDIFGDEKAVMYAYNSNDYTYQQVWNALTSAKNTDETAATVSAADLGLKKAFGANVESQKAALNVVKNGNITTTADGKYRILNWDSGIALDDTKTAPGVDLTLNVELNGYNVIFMVNGQAQIVNIPYNQLSVDKCPFDVTGVNHWVYQTYSDYKKGNYAFSPFSFNSTSDLKKINDGAKSVEEPQYVFIACFEKADNTAYAVFNASSSYNAIKGNYGNEYINKIIIPGKAAYGNNSTVIPLPAVQPVYETKNVLIGYEDSDSKAYSSTDKASVYGEPNSVKVFNANVVTYKYTITFDNGTDAKGIFYYSGDSQTETNSIETGALVAFSYNGVAYKVPAGGYDKLTDDAAKKAFNNILYPAKDGYEVTQWKDADGNVMLDKVKKDTANNKITYEVKFKKISSDMTFKANFEAKEYYIIYSGNTATMTNNMKQIVKVDESVSLFSDSTFSNDGYKLKEWNTRPDGKGTSYALGSSFSLNGAQYEDLEIVQASLGDSNYGLTLYAIWEKVGTSDNPGGNTDGGNDNTALYLIAGMLAVIAILAIVGIVLMRRKN